MSFGIPDGFGFYIVVTMGIVFLIVTVYALIKNYHKKSMEIAFKKPFYKDKPEDIKNKILNGM
jgi:hypothetical protein